MAFWIFILGTAFGSFLDVIASRYREDKFILSLDNIGGRSKCENCGSNLKWFELVPILSYIFQFGRCHNCKSRLSLRYPLIEILSGLIFIIVPWQLRNIFILNFNQWLILSVIWILIFWTLLLISLIDFRLTIIPDELSIFLAILGLLLIFFSPFGLLDGSFIKGYSVIFGIRQNVWLNHLFGAFIGLAFFAFLIAATRGKAMGIGDLKLAAALGVIFGWPDIILAIALAFIIGAVFGIAMIILGKKTMKGFLSFGPFLSLSSFAIFIFGYQIAVFYFNFF